MPTVALTDLFLRSVKADAQIDYWDERTPAFGVRVGKRSKTFMAKVENRRITIGTYPQVSLQEARKKALGIKSTGAPEQVSTITLKAAVEKFVTLHCKVKNRASTAKETERLLTVHFVEPLGHKPLAKLSHSDFSEVIDELVLSGRPSEANHAFTAARSFLRWCAKPPRRYIAISPLQGMDMPAPIVRRKRVLTDVELLSVWRAAVRQGYPHGTIVQSLICLGQRRGEVAALNRDWINEREQLITLPPEITKNGREHVFPYPDLFVEILEGIPRRNDTKLLFPSSGDITRPFNGWTKAMASLEWRPSIRHWTLHDLRRTFSTRIAELDVPQSVNDQLLNHVTGGELSPVAAIYNRAKLLPQMRSAMAVWNGHLSALIAA